MTSSASRKEAENFHVLPKTETAKDVGNKPAPTTSPDATTQTHVEPTQDTSLSPTGDRDPEAGTAVQDPAAGAQTNQPLDAPRRDTDRSQVS